MKKGLFASYVTGVTDKVYGESSITLLRYFFPELITSFILYLFPLLLDLYFIGHLKSTPAYVALSTTNNMIHFAIKIAEAFSVGTVILAGQLNGALSYKGVGKATRDSFWVTTLLGILGSCMLYFGAPMVYRWYGVHESVAVFGVPFLRIRALGVLCMFMFFALVGFMRAIKNSYAPMIAFAAGAITFVICDYIFIFGKLGFSPLGLQGSAWASVVQYFVMFSLLIVWMFFDPRCRKYSVDLFAAWTEPTYMVHFLKVSWPIVLDKATLAGAYLWLNKMITPMGLQALATFSAIKDIERCAFLPAVACAQIITFLVSNDMGNNNALGIKPNIKRIILMATFFVFTMLALLYWQLESVLVLFDKSKEFTPFVVRVFPILSVLVFFDLVQLILSAALRGSGNVKLVMIVRLLVCLFYFVPMSYLISYLPIQDETIKFILVYGSFYIGNALMSVIYVNWFRSDAWKNSAL